MPLMESYHYPECNLTAHVALYTSVTNGATLRQRIVSAATAVGPEGDVERDALNFAFINARLVRLKCSFKSNDDLLIIGLFFLFFFTTKDNQRAAFKDRDLSGYAGFPARITEDQDCTFRSTLGIKPDQQRTLKLDQWPAR
jgi:hypothetical protein